MEIKRKRSSQEVHGSLRNFLEDYMLKGMTFTTKDILKYTGLRWANPEHRLLNQLVKRGLLLKGYVHPGTGNGGRGGPARIVSYTVNVDDFSRYNAVLEDYRGRKQDVQPQKPEPKKPEQIVTEEKCPKCGFNIALYKSRVASLIRECGG